MPTLRELEAVSHRYQRYIDDMNFDDTDNFTKMFVSVLALRDAYEDKVSALEACQKEIHELRDKLEDDDREQDDARSRDFRQMEYERNKVEEECEALQAAMAEWQELVMATCERNSMTVTAELVRTLPAPSLERGREIVRNAERYQWLRYNSWSEQVEYNSWYLAVDLELGHGDLVTPEEIDAAIDAAREKPNV